MVWIVTVWSDPITFLLDFVCTLQAPSNQTKYEVDCRSITINQTFWSSKFKVYDMCSSYLERSNQTKCEVDCQSITINRSFGVCSSKFMCALLFSGDQRSIHHLLNSIHVFVQSNCELNHFRNLSSNHTKIQCLMLQTISQCNWTNTCLTVLDPILIDPYNQPIWRESKVHNHSRFKTYMIRRRFN